MSDVLETGAERLAEKIVPHASVSVASDPPPDYTQDLLDVKAKCRSEFEVPAMRRIISTDPGVRALVELVRSIESAPSAYWSVAARRALGKWERGDE